MDQGKNEKEDLGIVPMSINTILEGDDYNSSGFKRLRPRAFALMEKIFGLYSDLNQSVSYKAMLKDRTFSAQMFLFHNCYSSMPQGFLTLTRCHLKHSYYYLRAITESIQNSIFIFNNKEAADLWFSLEEKDVKKYKEKYKKWMYHGGKQAISSVDPYLLYMYKLSSDLIHPNFDSQTMITRIFREGEDRILRVNFQDIEKNREGLTNFFQGVCTHMKIHLISLQWWAGIEMDLDNAKELMLKVENLGREIELYTSEQNFN